MPAVIQSVINCLISFFEIHSDIKVCITQSLRGGLVAGTMTAIGGILLGPIGLAIGGVLGGTVAAITADEYKPIHEILGNSLTQEQKEKMAQEVMKTVKQISIVDVGMLATELVKNPYVQNQVVGVVTSLLQKDMNMKLR